MNVFHVTRREDLPSILNSGLEPRIGPRSLKLGEPCAAVYLFPDLEAVENALMNWLGDAFDDIELIVLEIDASSLSLEPGAGFELMSSNQIPAALILNILNDDFEIIPAQGHPVLSEARSALALYLNDTPSERLALSDLSDQLMTDQDPFIRSNMSGHITASALILSTDGEEVLMIHHNIYDRLLNPGGHHEGFESLMSAAFREGAEETGVQDLALHAWSERNARPFDIDSHAISANVKKAEGDHFHHDFMYLFVADPENPLAAQIEEVKEAAWFPTVDLSKSGDARLERLYAKLVENDLIATATRIPRP